MNTSTPPGPIVLFGSGETSASGQKIFDQLLSQLPISPRIALLETPAGFELNSAQVIGRVGDFLQQRLQNYHPQTEIVPARQRGTAFSPDDPGLAAPLLAADLIFLGPGSPTYAVRQLAGSLAWNYLRARHRLGAALVFASAAVVAIGAHALPVYEIYKVGEDLHWKAGLDFFAPFGLSLVFIPHWNNTDGGAELDTSRCFMGQARIERLLELLPAEQTVVGIDEHTALWLDCASQRCTARGLGTVTLQRAGATRVISSGEDFPMSVLGDCWTPHPTNDLPSPVWEAALQAARSDVRRDTPPPAEVLALVEERQSARARKDWRAADLLRGQIAALGWQVQDTPEGPVVSEQ